MKLSFRSRHNSITQLTPIEITDFAIITGLNGSGKTHLLKAIENGSIAVEEIPKDEIVYYNYNNFNVQKEQQKNDNQRSNNSANNIVRRINSERTQTLNKFTLLPQDHYNIIDMMVSNGYPIDTITWNGNEIESFKKITQLDPHSEHYMEAYYKLPEAIKFIFDMHGASPQKLEPLIERFPKALTDYIKVIFLRNIGFNRDFLEWTNADLEKYNELAQTGSTVDIWAYEDSLSQNFLNFMSSYQEWKGRFNHDIPESIEDFRKELLSICDKAEDFLRKNLGPHALRLLQRHSRNYNLLSTLQVDSGFLDINQLANEEKQYQIQKNRNELNAFLNQHRGRNTPYLSDADFIKAHGKSPVHLMNEALQKYDCNGYELHATKLPEEYGINVDQYPVNISLYNKKKNYQTNFEALSSGEKTLLALTFYIYKLKYRKKVIASLLLLDEIDSSLHPSMSKRLITVLYELFYKDLEINIILSTHSPSTVAFAPEDSLYIMNDSGADRLYPSTKDAALEELTSGVPSFSINYENRRQVFVESKYDVEYYERLYNIFKKHLNPDVSLNFIASGDVQKDKNGISKSSCIQVLQITKLLRDAGNKFIWGIIDWDTKKELPPCDHVKVLGWQQRYSIENFLFDPLLITVLLLLEKIEKPVFFGLDNDFKIYQILDLEENELQRLIDIILTSLSKHLDGDLNDKVTYQTIGGKQLYLPKAFTEHQGHDLEKKYLEVFPRLGDVKRGKEETLKLAVINKVIEEYPELAPISLLKILQQVQEV